MRTYTARKFRLSHARGRASPPPQTYAQVLARLLTDIHSQALLSKCPQPPSPTNRYVHTAVSLCPAFDTRPERHVRPQFLVRCPQIPIICQRPELRVVLTITARPRNTSSSWGRISLSRVSRPRPTSYWQSSFQPQIPLTASVPPASTGPTRAQHAGSFPRTPSPSRSAPRFPVFRIQESKKQDLQAAPGSSPA